MSRKTVWELSCVNLCEHQAVSFIVRTSKVRALFFFGVCQAPDGSRLKHLESLPHEPRLDAPKKTWNISTPKASVQTAVSLDLDSNITNKTPAKQKKHKTSVIQTLVAKSEWT